MNIPVAVVTISDSVAGGTRPDHSGPAVRHRLDGLGYRIEVQEIVADERGTIVDLLRSLSDGGRVRAVFTTGGTGIAARDVTPEATRDILEREIPGSRNFSLSVGFKLGFGAKPHLARCAYLESAISLGLLLR